MAAVQLLDVTSSAISKVAHDSLSNTLYVLFKGSKNAPGRAFRYYKVTDVEFEALLAAPSVGKHFAASIKRKKGGTELGDERCLVQELATLTTTDARPAPPSGTFGKGLRAVGSVLREAAVIRF